MRTDPAVWLTVFLAGCSTSGVDSDRDADDDAAVGRSSCFSVRDASSWTVLDRTKLIVYAPSKSRAFLVSISPPSSELRSAHDVAFVSRDNRICGRAGEKIVLPQMARSRSLTVMDVRRIDEDSLQRMLEIYGRAGRAPDVEPGASPGAEIEREIGDARDAEDAGQDPDESN